MAKLISRLVRHDPASHGTFAEGVQNDETLSVCEAVHVER